MDILINFAWASLILIIAPGPNSVLIFQTAIESGMGFALAILAGTELSVLLHCAAAGLGVSALVASSPTVYSAVKGIGIAYLFYLGVTGVYNGYKYYAAAADSRPAVTIAGKADLFKRGLITGLLNVAMIMVAISFFPQFIVNPHDIMREWWVLTALFMAVHLCWYSCLITLLSGLRKYMLRPKVMGAIKMTTNGLLLLLVAKLIFK